MKNLFVFSHKRTFGEALVFAILFFILGVLLGGALGGLNAAIFNLSKEEAARQGLRVGYFTALVFFPCLSLLILISKKLYKNIWALFLFLLTIIGTLLFAGIVGIIPPTILSMFDKNEQDTIQQ